MTQGSDMPSRPSDKGIATGRWVVLGVDLSANIDRADRRLVKLGVFRSGSRPLVKLQSLLAAVAIITAVLFFLTALMRRWHHGAGSGSVGVEVLGWIVWITYTLAKFALVALAVATVYQWFRSRRQSSARA